MNIQIFGTPHCGNCVKVKEYLDSIGVEYIYKNIGNDITKESVDELAGVVVKSAPVILIDGKLEHFNAKERSITGLFEVSDEDINDLLDDMTI